MTISFNQIPSSVRVPLVYIEFDNSKANAGLTQTMHKLLVLGQMLSSGTAAANVPVRITSADQAQQLFGRGSMLAQMFRHLKAANRYHETWALPQAENAAGAAATGTWTFGGEASAAGTLNLCIAGQRVQVAVAVGDDGAAVATKAATAVAATPDLPVAAAVADAVVTLTCRWKGETGNDIDLRANYYDETTPAGITVAMTAMAGGTSNPDIAPTIAAMGDEWWNGIVCPYTDSANMVALEAELTDRDGPTRMLDALAFTAYRGTHGGTGTFGEGRNHHLVTCLGTNSAPQPPYIWAAVSGVVAAAALADDPARPTQTLQLPGIMPPAIAARWNMEERNLLLYDGIATYSVGSDGVVRLERQVSMYQENAYGVADASWLDINTPATLARIRYETRARITQKFPRHKLADDGTRYGAGQAVVTPSVLRAELLALFRQLEEYGWVEDFDQYKADLVVERDGSDRNRVNVLSNPNLVNQFRIYAERIQFIV